MKSNLAYQHNSSCTYQHLIGDMLIRLNRLSSELKLSHSEYRVMSTLIGLYNKTQCKAYPTIEYLCSCCCMGKQTVIKALHKLVELNLLVIVKSSGRRNNYHITNLLLDGEVGIHVIPPGITPCNTTHDMNKQNKTNRIINNNNDDNLNKPDNSEYKQVLEQLNNWNFAGGRFVIKTHGIRTLRKLIELVKIKNPQNKGAYLRKLLNLPGDNIPERKIDSLPASPAMAILKANEIKTINEPRLSKKEIILKLISEGKLQEALTLSKLWKISIDSNSP